MNSESAHTNLSPNPRGVMTSTERTRTVPVSIGFMRRPHDPDEFDNKHEKKSTQEEQDAEDEKARKQIMKNLVNSWQERLQLLSVITTFFATTEAAMLVNTKPGPDDGKKLALMVSNASLLGSLILHVYASVLSFLGAFLLISYKLREARREERIVEGLEIVASPLEAAIQDVEQGLRRTSTNGDTHSTPKRNVLDLPERPVFSTNPHVEEVGLLASHTSSHRILSRTHAVCVFLAAVGFVLALVGILGYTWAVQPPSVSIFTTVCLGGALLSMLAMWI